MQVVLAAVTVGAGLLGLAYANLAPQRRYPRWQALGAAGLRSLPGFIGACVGLLALFAAPAFKPFSPGLTLGWGFLIGGVLGLYAVFEAAGSAEGRDWSPRVVGLLSAAAIGPSAILLIFRGYPNEALMGCALGAVLVAAIADSLARPVFAVAAAEAGAVLSCYRGTTIFALATTTVALAARLAIERFPRMEPGAPAGGYWALPGLLIMAAALALILIAFERGTGRRWSLLLSGVVAAAVAMGVMGALQAKLLPEVDWRLGLYGMLTFGFMLAALLRGDPEAEDDRPTSLAFGAVLLALMLVTIAFKALHGYGEALALVIALPVVAAIYVGGDRSREPIAESLAVGAFTIALLLALFRVFFERVGHGWALDFQRHYDSLAVVLGAAAGFAVLALVDRSIDRASHGAHRLRGRTVALGLLVTATPLAITAVWGVRATAAFLMGLVVAEATWMMLAAWLRANERARVLAAAPHAYFVGASLIAAQFAPLIVGLELTRGIRVAILAIITAGAVIWLVADDIGHRREEGPSR